MKHFKNLLIWQKGMVIARDCYKLIEQFPKQERFGLASQITRAAVSIPSNIAEGSSRKSEKDYGRFIDISIGSAFELETQLLISQSVNFGDQDLLLQLIKLVKEEQKMLTGFDGKLLR